MEKSFLTDSNVFSTQRGTVSFQSIRKPHCCFCCLDLNIYSFHQVRECFQLFLQILFLPPFKKCQLHISYATWDCPTAHWPTQFLNSLFSQCLFWIVFRLLNLLKFFLYCIVDNHSVYFSSSTLFSPAIFDLDHFLPSIFVLLKTCSVAIMNFVNILTCLFSHVCQVLVGFDRFFSFLWIVFLLLCIPGNVWWVTWWCQKLWTECWIILYSYKNFRALF